METYRKYLKTCLSRKSGNCVYDNEKCKACYEDYINFPYSPIEVDQRVYDRLVKALREQFGIKD